MNLIKDIEDCIFYVFSNTRTEFKDEHVINFRYLL